jgi:hypothetical protein
MITLDRITALCLPQAHLWYGRHREAPGLQALWCVSHPYNAIGASLVCLA